MRAILLAAGFGTRLKPLTLGIPKCLVPIGGKPLLEIWLDSLSQYGVSSFLINTHYLAEQVEKFIKNSHYAAQVELISETKLKGTAGTLIANLGFFDDEDAMLIHADNYCNENFSYFIDAHKSRPSRALLSMMTFKTTDPSSCGIVELDKEKIVKKFHEKKVNPPGNLANGAVYILSPEFCRIIKKDFYLAKDFSTEILPNFLDRIYAYEAFGAFIDIGTPGNYALANKIACERLV